MVTEGGDGGSGGGDSEEIRIARPTGPVIAAGDPAASALAVSRELFVAAPAAVVVAPTLEGDELEEAGTVCGIDMAHVNKGSPQGPFRE